MQSFFEWYDSGKIDPAKTWLILGKGPSYSKRHAYDLSEFNLLSLNHAVREQPVAVAHMIDYDVVDACADKLEQHAGVLVMPWVPHVESRRGERNLRELLAENETLQRMDRQGRLLWYNLHVHGYDPQARDLLHLDSPPVTTRYFSAEAAVNLLVQAGARSIRTLGVDGGTTYSGTFDDLKDTTLLNISHNSFDKQFREILRTVMKTGIDYAPLDAEGDAPIRVYVGSLEAQMLPVKVLEYSIRKHTDLPTEVFPIHRSNIKIPMPREPENRPRTPFSFQRFFIPALANYQGRAIYMDSDMQVFRNVRHLWTQPFAGAELLAVKGDTYSDRRPQFSVMLLDCDKLRWDITEIVKQLDSGELTYEQLMFEMKVAKEVRADISPEWNSLEHYEDGKTALLHYTDMPTQPWVSCDNKWGYLWTRDLFEAIDDGFITVDYVRDQIRRGHVRPSLLHQIERRIEDSTALGRARLLDRYFRPPAHTMREQKSWRTVVRDKLNVGSMRFIQLYDGVSTKKPFRH
ncbi:MAG: glycosyltransferase [Acidobacteriota bacterium]|nr:glycosyltransferase [Acidobacteriota bacterium]